MHDALDTLQTLLSTALGLLDEVAADVPIGRLLAVFARMPRADRDAILTVLEREVDARRLAHASDGALTGCRLVPNRNARLYFRVFEHDESRIPALTYEEFMRGTLASARAVHRLAPRDRECWETATLDAFRQLDPAERESLRRLNHDVLRLLDEATDAPAARATEHP
ncbi:MAG TPA: hypothetical protein VKW76_15355 [Candidatus Binatia bacterium]|nr:hypothetical protein [Candidatus Binatia bacterium]